MLYAAKCNSPVGVFLLEICLKNELFFHNLSFSFLFVGLFGFFCKRQRKCNIEFFQAY